MRHDYRHLIKILAAHPEGLTAQDLADAYPEATKGPEDLMTGVRSQLKNTGVDLFYQWTARPCRVTAKQLRVKLYSLIQQPGFVLAGRKAGIK